MKKIDSGSNMRFEKIYADILKPASTVNGGDDKSVGNTTSQGRKSMVRQQTLNSEVMDKENDTNLTAEE